jgi:hypothetical protein
MRHYLIKNRSVPIRHLKAHIAHVGAHAHKKHHVKGGSVLGGLAGSSQQPAWGPIREQLSVIEGEGVKHKKKHVKPLHIKF